MECVCGVGCVGGMCLWGGRVGGVVSGSSFWHDCYTCYEYYKLLNFQMAHLSDKPVGYLIFLFCPNNFLLLINVALAFKLDI